MPREKEAYRLNVERIKEMYPNRELLSIKEVCIFLGRDYQTVKKQVRFNNNYVSVATLASQLS